jgi:hypothetical protein
MGIQFLKTSELRNGFVAPNRRVGRWKYLQEQSWNALSLKVKTPLKK